AGGATPTDTSRRRCWTSRSSSRTGRSTSRRASSTGRTSDTRSCASCGRDPGSGPAERARLGPLVDRHVAEVGRPDVLRRRPDEAEIVVLLEHVCGPSRDAARREDRREQVVRYPEQGVDRPRVEVEVGVEPLLVVYDVLDLREQIVVPQVPLLLPDPPQPFAQDRSARVFYLVDTVAEPHDPLVAGELRSDDALGVGRFADLAEELHNPLVRSAVEGSLQGPDRARDRTVEVAQGRRGDARGEGRCVELVVRVQDERDVKRVRVEVARLAVRERIEGVRGLGEVRPGHDRLAAGPASVEAAEDRGKDGGEALRTADRARPGARLLGLEQRERADG